MKLNLIVIRTDKSKALSEFYEKLGMSFEYHKHGKGLFHYSTVFGDGLVFEIYPLLKSQKQVDNSIRLGFKVSNLDSLIKKLINADVIIEKKPQHSKWGYYAVIKDLDGRKIELLEENN